MIQRCGSSRGGTSMARILVEMRCHLAGKKADSSLSVIIEAPEKLPPSGDYCCRVTASPGLDFRLDVFGVIPQDAIRSALELVALRIGYVLASDLTDEGDASDDAEG
jgi:hypothetical protein